MKTNVQTLCKETIITEPSSFEERRTNGRCPLIAAAELVDSHANSHMATRTADIDRGGCYIDTLNPLPVGCTVTLRLSRENQSFSANAEVVYVQNGNGMGLAFTDAEAEQLETLNEWIAGPDAAMTPNNSRSRSPQLSQQATISHQCQQPLKKAANEPEEQLPLTYLILMLIQKNVLSEMEGKALLEKLVV